MHPSTDDTSSGNRLTALKAIERGTRDAVQPLGYPKSRECPAMDQSEDRVVTHAQPLGCLRNREVSPCHHETSSDASDIDKDVALVAQCQQTDRYTWHTETRTAARTTASSGRSEASSTAGRPSGYGPGGGSNGEVGVQLIK